MLPVARNIALWARTCLTDQDAKRHFFQLRLKEYAGAWQDVFGSGSWNCATLAIRYKIDDAVDALDLYLLSGVTTEKATTYVEQSMAGTREIEGIARAGINERVKVHSSFLSSFVSSLLSRLLSQLLTL